MPRGPSPSWRQRKPPLLDSHILASVADGTVNDEGQYSVLVYTGCETRERALEIKRALFRAAKRQGVSVTAKVEKHGKEFAVRFRAIDKATARKYVIERYGPDRSLWPYNPRKRGN